MRKALAFFVLFAALVGTVTTSSAAEVAEPLFEELHDTVSNSMSRGRMRFTVQSPAIQPAVLRFPDMPQCRGNDTLAVRDVLYHTPCGRTTPYPFGLRQVHDRIVAEQA